MDNKTNNQTYQVQITSELLDSLKKFSNIDFNLILKKLDSHDQLIKNYNINFHQILEKLSYHEQLIKNNNLSFNQILEKLNSHDKLIEKINEQPPVVLDDDYSEFLSQQQNDQHLLQQQQIQSRKNKKDIDNIQREIAKIKKDIIDISKNDINRDQVLGAITNVMPRVEDSQQIVLCQYQNLKQQLQHQQQQLQQLQLIFTPEKEFNQILSNHTNMILQSQNQTQSQEQNINSMQSSQYRI